MNQRKQFIDGVTPNTPQGRIDDFSRQHTIGVSPQQRLRKAKNTKIGDTNGVVNSKSSDKLESILSNQPDKKRQTSRLSSMNNQHDQIDEEEAKPKGWRAKRKHKKALKKETKKQRSKFRVFAKRSALIMSAIVVAYFGFVFLKAWSSLGNIIDRAGAGSPLLGASITASELYGEGDGRVNILLIGMGGAHHEGGSLADTIMILSIDPIAKEAGLLSIPRDFYVNIPGYGQRKINDAHAYGELYGFEDPDIDASGGPGLMEATLEQVLGIPIHYYISVDFDGYKSIVDALDGITIELDHRVYDPIFNREYGYGALDVGPGVVELDGQTALLLGRARGSHAGSVGLATSDFARGEHQRLMLIAIKDKALSLGTYSDPTNIIKVLDAIGDHLRTNLQLGELMRLKDLAEEVPSASILNFGIEDYIYTDTVNGLSVVLPRDPSYQDIQHFVRNIFEDGFIKSEDAVVDVLNGTSIAGLASTQVAELESYGYNIGTVDNAPTQNFLVTKLYAMNDLKPYTKNYLEKRYDVEASDISTLPEGITTDADFVLILGQDAQVEDEVHQL